MGFMMELMCSIIKITSSIIEYRYIDTVATKPPSLHKILILIAIIDYKLNVYVRKTIENT